MSAEGEFEWDILIKGTRYDEIGERYEGEFDYGQPHGQGTWYDADGKIKHQGRFERGVPVTG